MKLFLHCAAALTAMLSFSAPALAQSSSVVYDGEEYEVINLEAIPAGASCYETTKGVWTINRSCPEFATLYKNGHIMKQVPASNVRDVYTFSGFDRTPSGTLHVTFYARQETTPAKYTGYYVVVIPAGFLIDSNGEPNSEIRANYYVNNSEFISDPATGSRVESLSKITLTFPDALTLSTSGTACDYEFIANSAASEEDPDPNAKNASIVPTVEGNTATFTFPTEFKTAGRMMLSIPTGTFTTTYAEGPANSRNYFCGITIDVTGKTGSLGNWAITPAPGSYTGFESSGVEGTGTQYSPDPYQAYFILNAPEGKSVKMAGAKKIQFVAADGTTTDFGKGVTPDKSGVFIYNSTYKLWRAQNTFTPLPGEYELLVPAETITLDDNTTNPELRFKYTVNDSMMDGVSYTISPSLDNVLTSPLDNIVIDFPSATSVSWTVGYTYANIVCGDIEYVATGQVDPENPTRLVLTIPGGLQNNGVYNVTIPPTALMVDNKSCPLSFTYTIKLESSSVEEVVASADAFDVYTLGGVKVAEGVYAAAVKALAPAIYVINGKKVVVK